MDDHRKTARLQMLDSLGVDPDPRRGFYWPATAIWSLIVLAAIASALAVLAAILWLGAVVIWPLLTLDLIAPTASQVMEPGFSIEAVTARAWEGM